MAPRLTLRRLVIFGINVIMVIGMVTLYRRTSADSKTSQLKIKYNEQEQKNQIESKKLPENTPTTVFIRKLESNHIASFTAYNQRNEALKRSHPVTTIDETITHNTLIANDSKSFNDSSKIILWYVKARYINPILVPQKLNNCPWNCSLTTNREYQNESSAFVFAAQILKEMPPIRNNDQAFVLHNHEPQCAFPSANYFRRPEWKSQINWTMWYRFDSDIHEPYGILKRRDVVPEKDYANIVSKKTKFAAWVVSNCGGQANRVRYAKELQKYIDIDIFGLCGNKTCSRGTDSQCLDLISKDYKFYLSFESSFCPDYITEKFFRYYRADLILIARGGANYSKEAPDGTFINTQDYKTVKDLTDYLKRLNEHDDEYISILKKKDQYESIYEGYPIFQGKTVTYQTYHYEEQPFCDLCKRLWNIEQYRSHHQDIGVWFDKKHCKPPTDLNFKK